MPKIKNDLIDLLINVQGYANVLLIDMPKPDSSGRANAWREYQKARSLESALREALERLSA